jgi:hypothetical protein
MKGLRKESSLQRDANRSVGPATLQQGTDRACKASPVDRKRHHPGLGCQHERLRQPHRSVVDV